jgi:hypothetical protein
MANLHKGEVSLDLDGKAFTLRFDMNALAEAEALLGRSVIEEISGGHMGFATIRALFYAGASPSRYFNDLRGAGRCLPLARLKDVAGAIGEALQAAMPAPETGEAGDEGEA